LYIINSCQKFDGPALFTPELLPPFNIMLLLTVTPAADGEVFVVVVIPEVKLRGIILPF